MKMLFVNAMRGLIALATVFFLMFFVVMFAVSLLVIVL